MYIKFNREKSITKRKRKLIELHFEFEFLFYAFWPDYLVNFCVCVAPNDSFLCWKVFFSCSEELKKFFFSRELNTFFLLLLLLFVSFMSILTVPSTLLLSSGRRRLRFFLSTSSSSPHSTALCVLAHTYTRARAHTHSVTHACILHSYEPSRAFIRSSCMCACVSVCTTCLRETSVQCSIRNHMFFSFIAVRRKMPPDGILNVKCAIRHWAYTRTSVHVCMCVCVSVSFRTCMHVCIVQSMPEEFGGTFWTGDFVIFNFFEMAAENARHFPALQ